MLALAKKVIAIESLTDSRPRDPAERRHDLGGTKRNIVPEHAEAWIDVRLRRERAGRGGAARAGADRRRARRAGHAAPSSGASCTARRAPPSGDPTRLLALQHEIARGLGYPAPEPVHSAGVTDGSLTAARGRADAGLAGRARRRRAHRSRVRACSRACPSAPRSRRVLLRRLARPRRTREPRFTRAARQVRVVRPVSGGDRWVPAGVLVREPRQVRKEATVAVLFQVVGSARRSPPDAGAMAVRDRRRGHRLHGRYELRGPRAPIPPADLRRRRGQEHVVTALRNAIKLGRRAARDPARGSARRRARPRSRASSPRALNCDEGPTDEAVRPTARRAARSPAGTRHRRAARSTPRPTPASTTCARCASDVRYAAAPGKHRIFIIDEVHMLSTRGVQRAAEDARRAAARAVCSSSRRPTRRRFPHTVLSRVPALSTCAGSRTRELLALLRKICARRRHRGARAACSRAIAREADWQRRDALTLLDRLTSARWPEASRLAGCDRDPRRDRPQAPARRARARCSRARPARRSQVMRRAR